jgi:hypothetical protein
MVGEYLNIVMYLAPGNHSTIRDRNIAVKDEGYSIDNSKHCFLLSVGLNMTRIAGRR